MEYDPFSKEFSIPNQYQLGGLTWKVVYRKRMKHYGECALDKQEIRILSTLEPEIKEQTFCHELVHSILIAMGRHSDAHNEVFVDGFAMYLHQYLKSAK